MARVTSCVCVSRVAPPAPSKTLPSRNPANRPGWLRVRRRMPPSISTEARALSQASSWPVSTMPPDLIVTVESDAVPGSSSTSATRIEPEVSLPSPAIVSMPVPLAPTTISCDPVVHSEPASSMLATPSAPSCLPSNAAPVVALAPSPAPGRRRRGRPAPPRRSPPATRYPGQTTGRCRSRPNAPRASRLRSARERLRKRPASRSRTRPAPARPRPCAIRCSGRKAAPGRRPLVNPDARAIALEDRAVLDFQLPGFVLVDAGLQWRRTVVPGRRTHARRRADFTRRRCR